MKTPAATHPDSVLEAAQDSTIPDEAVASVPDHERARAEAEALWAALAGARSTGVPRVIASAEDAVYRFYLPLAHALAAGAAPRQRTPSGMDPMGGVHAAELGLASAVLSWHGAEPGFLRCASVAITERLHRSSAVALPVRGRQRRRITIGAAGCPESDDIVRRIH